MTDTRQGHEPHPQGAYAEDPDERKRRIPETPAELVVAASLLRQRADATAYHRAEVESRVVQAHGDRIPSDVDAALANARVHLQRARGYLGMDGHPTFERAPAIDLGLRCLAWAAAYLDVAEGGCALATVHQERLAELRALVAPPVAE